MKWPETPRSKERKRRRQVIEVVRSAAPLGAEVKGVDVGAGVDDAAFARVRDALHERSVIVLRDQKMTPEQQVAFCARFGSLERHALPQYIIDGYPALARISNILDEAGKPIG